MPSHLDWPFFEDRHRALAHELDAWATEHISDDHGDVDAQCRALVQSLGQGGWLRHIYREVIGAYNAAMSAVVVKALMEDRAKVEVEATAVIPLG